MFLPSFHYCINVEFPVNPCIGNTPPPDIGTLLCFRLRAGPKLANVFWRGSGSTFWSVSSDLTQDCGGEACFATWENSSRPLAPNCGFR
jgi:hypothetical protein